MQVNERFQPTIVAFAATGVLTPERIWPAPTGFLIRLM